MFSRIHPVIIGTICCIGSALGYSTVNALKRLLTVDCDRAMVLCVQDSVSVVVVGAWLIWHVWRGCGGNFLPGRSLVGVILVGLASQFLGNLPVIWAMSVVGLGITITLLLGVNLLGSAVLGRAFLGERVSLQSAAAMILLIVSVVLLSLGAGRANDAMAASADVATGPFWVAVAILAACLAGLVYATLGVAVRHMLICGTPGTIILFIVPATGVATLGPLSLFRQGLSGILQTPVQNVCIMLIAGALNLLAYMAALQGLKLLSVLHTSVLSASQVAMAAMAGFLFFHEPPSVGLMLGVVLTVVGILLLDRPKRNDIVDDTLAV